VTTKPQPAAPAPVKPIETASATNTPRPTTPGEPVSQPRPAQAAASQAKRIFVPPASSPGNQQVRVVVVEPPAVPPNGGQPGVPVTLAQRIDLPSAPPPAPIRAAELLPPAASEPKPQSAAAKPQAAAPKVEAAGRSNVLAPSEPITVQPAVTDRPASVAYVPPRPINQAQPSLPREISKMLYGEATVDVRVKIDANGRVAGVEAVSRPGPLRPFLERAALDAARLWRFSPAMMGDRPVAGETVVQFTFRSAQGIR
jgi:protein TonB